MSRRAEELGRKIGSQQREQLSVKDNLSANDPDALLNIVNSIRGVLRGTLTVTKKTYDSDSFVIDHPTQGEIDSAVLLIDGGYVPSGTIEYVSGSFAYPAAYQSGEEVVYTTTY